MASLPQVVLVRASRPEGRMTRKPKHGEQGRKVQVPEIWQEQQQAQESCVPLASLRETALLPVSDSQVRGGGWGAVIPGHIKRGIAHRAREVKVPICIVGQRSLLLLLWSPLYPAAHSVPSLSLLMGIRT